MKNKHLARRTDPKTSKAAAARVESFSKSHAAKIMRALKEPMTAQQISVHTNLTDIQICRRLPELLKAKMVKRLNETGRNHSGRPAHKWERLA